MWDGITICIVIIIWAFEIVILKIIFSLKFTSNVTAVALIHLGISPFLVKNYKFTLSVILVIYIFDHYLNHHAEIDDPNRERKKSY